MQSNKKLSLNPVINDLKEILTKGRLNSKKVILSELEELYVYLRGRQALKKGRLLHQDEKGNIIEIEKMN